MQTFPSVIALTSRASVEVRRWLFATITRIITQNTRFDVIIFGRFRFYGFQHKWFVECALWLVPNQPFIPRCLWYYACEQKAKVEKWNRQRLHSNKQYNLQHSSAIHHHRNRHCNVEWIWRWWMRLGQDQIPIWHSRYCQSKTSSCLGRVRWRWRETLHHKEQDNFRYIWVFGSTDT